MLDSAPIESSQATIRQTLLGAQALVRFRRFTLAFRKYAGQPRLPAGGPDAGQFTFGELRQPRADKPVRLAQNRPRGGGRSARWPDATPGQEARLAASEMRANAAVARIRDIDATWRPEAGLYENIEGEILKNEATARQAERRFLDLQRARATPGPFAGESVAASGIGTRPSASTQREIDRIGNETGCHTWQARVVESIRSLRRRSPATDGSDGRSTAAKVLPSMSRLQQITGGVREWSSETLN